MKTQRIVWRSLLPVLLILVLPTRVQAQWVPEWRWAQSVFTDSLHVAGTDYIAAVDRDAAGNTYVTGNFTDFAQIGPWLLISQGQQDVFVAKLDGSGQVVWAISGGSALGEGVADLKVDQQGNVYVAGNVSAPFFTACGTVAHPTGAASSGYLWKIGRDGTCRWIRMIAEPVGGSFPGAYVGALAIDPTSYPVLTGGFAYDARIGNVALTSQGSDDAWIARFDSAGTMQWVRTVQGPGAESGFGITTARNGNLMASVKYYAPTPPQAGPFPLGLPGTTAAILALDSAGNWQWAHQTGPGWELSLLLTTVGNTVFLADWVRGTSNWTLDTTSWPAAGGGRNQMIAGFDVTTGNVRFVRQFLAQSDASGLRIDGLASDGQDVFATGRGWGTMSFGAGPPVGLTSGSLGGMVLKLDSLGQYQWSLVERNSTQHSGLIPAAIAVGGPAGPVIAGVVQDSAQLGHLTLRSRPQGIRSLFVAQVDEILGQPGRTSSNQLFQVFPNPARTIVRISGGQGAVALLDVLGRVVATAQGVDDESYLLLEGLTPGLYTVRRGAVSKRLVVE